MHLRPPKKSDRGASAIEFVLAALILVPLTMGIADFGLLWQKRQTVGSATRSAARRGAATCLVITNSPSSRCDLGNEEIDDYQMLVAVRAALGTSANEVEKIVIYRVTDIEGDGSPITDGHPVHACTEAAPPGGIDGLCNVYGKTELLGVDTTPESAADAPYGCSGLAVHWCPKSRSRANSHVESIGVYIRLRHPHVTGFFGSSAVVDDYAVFRLEPNAAAPDVAIPLPVIPPPPTTTTTTTTTTVDPSATTTTIDTSSTSTTEDPSATISTGDPSATITTEDPSASSTTTTGGPTTTTTFGPTTTTSAPTTSAPTVAPTTTTTTTTTAPPPPLPPTKKCC